MHRPTLFLVASLCLNASFAFAEPVPLFDGKTFAGWEGDTESVWRIERGEIVAGKPDEKLPKNNFLCTTREFANFDLRLEYLYLLFGDGGPAQGDNQSGNRVNSTGRGGPATQGSATQAGLTPGEYVFYVYTGSRGDVYNTKDGTVARNAFIADEKGYLGMFSCGVSTDEGTGPG